MAPCPDGGRARGRLNAGTAAAVVAEMRHHPAGPNRGSPGRLVRWPWRVARTIRDGGPSRVVPMRQPRITGYGGRCACCVITRARRSTPKAVGRVSFAAHHAREILKGQPSGGHAEQALEHHRQGRRRNGGLAALPAREGRRHKAQSPGTRPGRLGAEALEARRSIATPAFRALLFSRGIKGTSEHYGRPGARTIIWDGGAMGKETQVVNRGYECRCRGLQPSPRLKCVHARRRRALAVGRVDRRSVAQAGGVGGLRILAIPPTPARSPRSRRRPSPPLRGGG